MVIIAAGPFTLRKGRRHSRSIVTPSTPENDHGDHEGHQQHPASGRPGQDHVLTGQAEHLQHPHGDEASRP